MMPNMNGVQATRELREFGFENIVMGLTGNTLQDEMDEFEGAGADVVLPKPMTIKALDILIQYVMAQGPSNWTKHKEGRPNPLQTLLAFLESKLGSA